MAAMAELIQLRIVEVVQIRDQYSVVDPDGDEAPFYHSTGTLGSSGATDKRDDPEKQRMLVNNSAPNGSVQRPVRARNMRLTPRTPARHPSRLPWGL